MRSYLHSAVLASFALLGGCATQPGYQQAALKAPPTWSNAPDDTSLTSTETRENWWTLLGDRAVDRLVEAGLNDNPTLAEAIARVDQARAVLGVQNAQRLPSVVGQASVTRSKDSAGSGGSTIRQTSAAIGASASWEIDLWGRVRQSKVAAQSRLAARNADADAVRLSVTADIADTVQALRGCQMVLEIRDRDIASREAELSITRRRLAFGSVAPVAVAAAETNLAAVKTERILQQEACQRLVDALVALSGVQPTEIRQILPRDETKIASVATMLKTDDHISQPPAFVPALPATVLLGHPAVIAAEREVAARWAEIAVARAERLPRIDLAALLTGQWIRALGSSDSYVSNSIGAGLTVPLFDGGAGGFRVRGAQAAYREAVARLEITVRAAIRDIEDALAAQQSARARIETSQSALDAAQFTLTANEARWRAGAIAQFELEDTRRQFNLAQENAVLARADRARAWIALMQRTGAPARFEEEAVSEIGGSQDASANSVRNDVNER